MVISFFTKEMLRTNIFIIKYVKDLWKKINYSNSGDFYFLLFTKCCAILVFLVFVLIGIVLLVDSSMAISKFGFKFLYTSIWDPVNEVFGALPVIYGTTISSLLAIIIAAPLSVSIALFLTEIAPERISKIISFLIETLAAIPSVIYGFWGLFILAPWLRDSFEPFLAQYFGFLPFFSGTPYGVGMLGAGIILSIMIIPTISSVSREVFLAVPTGYREAALAIGATKYEMMKLAILKNSYGGIFGAIILGLGRAIGETMAVTMVIGNKFDISISLFAPSQTMASLIANEYTEAVSEIHLSALGGVGLVLFGVTFIINVLARALIMKITKKLL